MNTPKTKQSPWVTDFEKQRQNSVARHLAQYQNWQGDNWLYVADWSDNYSWQDWYFECSFSYPASAMWDNMNDLAVTKQRF
jgi:inorganic pyrophosphatase